MYAEEIRNLVITKLNEFSPFSDDSGEIILAGGDTLPEIKPVYHYVDNMLEEAANEVLLIAPLSKLNYEMYANYDTQHFLSEKIGSRSLYLVSIPISQSYLRLHTLQLEDWKTALHSTVRVGEPLEILQYNEFTCGTPQKPIALETSCVLQLNNGNESEHYQVINAYSSSVQEPKYKFWGIERFKILSSRQYVEEVGEIIALNCAKKVCQTLGFDKANIFDEEYKRCLSLLGSA